MPGADGGAMGTSTGMTRQRIRWPVVVDRAREIVESYEGGVTLRQVIDRLASVGVLPHRPSMYRHLCPPTSRRTDHPQIRQRAGLSSTSSVAYQLGRLEARGLISRTGRSRCSCRPGR